MKNLKFSIRYKILLVTTILLVTAISLYLMLATRVFKQDKTELVFDLNKSVVSTLATELETTLKGVTDKLRLYAYIYAGLIDRKTQRAFQEIVEKDPLLVRLELYEINGSRGNRLVSSITEKEYSKLYNLDENFYEVLSSKKNIPFELIQTQKLGIWNSTIENGPPLIGLGISVIKEDARGFPIKLMAVVGYVKVDKFLKNLRTSSLAQVSVINSEGKTLIHLDPKVMIEAKSISDSPIVKQINQASFSTGVSEFEYRGAKYLGAFSKVGLGDLSVISQVSSHQAFLAVQSLVVRSLLFALIIITVTFIATIIFSRTLTHPILRLMNAMEKVSAGDLDASLRIQSHDEIAVLSDAFNKMTVDLKSSRSQLEEINRELEKKVIDRTKKLEEQNRAVKEAQEALIRTTRLASVGEIAGRTAHEVLNPLTSLMTRVQKVQKRLNDEISNRKNLLGEIVKAWNEEIKDKGFDGFISSLKEPSSIDPTMTLLEEDLTNIREIFGHWDGDLKTLETDAQFLLQQASRIEKILQQMRGLSAASGKKDRISMHDVLHETVNISADLFSKNRVVLEEKYQATNDHCQVDHDEFIQAMTNLLRNSLYAVIEAKYQANEGYVVITTSNSGGKFFIDIKDNGVGIAIEHQAKLFEKQFSTKSPELGTGLGLSISRRFIRSFHGDLFLKESKSGEGTVFRIELPLSDGHKSEVAA